MPELRAVLVGIDAYPPPVPPLMGCVNDVEAMAETLAAQVPEDDLRLLADERAGDPAGRDRGDPIAPARERSDSTALFYQRPWLATGRPSELWPHEPDRRNETVVLVDSRSTGGWDLADKELSGLLAGVSGSVGHLLVVLDCCHSGDGTRDAPGWCGCASLLRTAGRAPPAPSSPRRR